MGLLSDDLVIVINCLTIMFQIVAIININKSLRRQHDMLYQLEEMEHDIDKLSDEPKPPRVRRF